MIGHKRAEALGDSDAVVGAFDLAAERAGDLGSVYGPTACRDLDALLALAPDVGAALLKGPSGLVLGVRGG